MVKKFDYLVSFVNFLPRGKSYSEEIKGMIVCIDPNVTQNGKYKFMPNVENVIQITFQEPKTVIEQMVSINKQMFNRNYLKSDN